MAPPIINQPSYISSVTCALSNHAVLVLAEGAYPMVGGSNALDVTGTGFSGTCS